VDTPIHQLSIIPYHLIGLCADPNLHTKSQFPQFRGSIRSTVPRHFSRNYPVSGLRVNKNPTKSKTPFSPQNEPQSASESANKVRRG
jgi:hypothetical protein